MYNACNTMWEHIARCGVVHWKDPPPDGRLLHKLPVPE